MAPNLIPEFERVVGEAQPTWFLMENVQHAPLPAVPGYIVHAELFDNRWLGEEQSRRHLFSFGTRDGRRIEFESVALENPKWAPRVMAAGGATVKLRESGVPKRVRRTGKYRVRAGDFKSQSNAYFLDAVRLQGLPEDWDLPPFTVKAKIQALGNGVPIMPMGRAISKAVSAAMARPR